MGTTIMVNENTLQVLKELKDRFHAKSYDETVMRLAAVATNTPESKFGSRPKMKPFSSVDRDDAHEL